MKIIKENKEKLPVDFVTQFISSSWGEVGNLKASIKGIKENFKGAEKISDILQDLVDAYLIAIGQFEGYLSDKEKLALDTNIKEALTEDVNNEPEAIEEISDLIKDEIEAIDGYDKALEIVRDNTTGEVLKHIRSEEKEHINELSDTLNGKVDDNEAELVQDEIEKAEDTSEDTPTKSEVSEPFEYFTDFDEPEITDEDRALYNSSLYMTHKN